MKKAEEIVNKHTLLLPYCQILGGFTVEYWITVEFDYSGIEGDATLKITSVEGFQLYDGKKFDMSFLIDEPDNPLYMVFFDLVFYNRDNWDNTERWW